MAFWKRQKGEFDDLEARLRAGRPEPRDDLVQSVSAAVQKPPLRSRTAFRLGLAAALTAALLVPLAAVGGVSDTTSAAKGLVTFVKSGSFSGSPTTGSGKRVPRSKSVSPSNNQYGEPMTICHRRGNQDPGNTLRLSRAGALAHLANHSLDYAGPCRS